VDFQLIGSLYIALFLADLQEITAPALNASEFYFWHRILVYGYGDKSYFDQIIEQLYISPFYMNFVVNFF
jgi:hypothetical protein